GRVAIRVEANESRGHRARGRRGAGDRTNPRRRNARRELFDEAARDERLRAARALVLVAQLHRRRAAVGRRLIPDREVCERRSVILQRIRALDVERIEARSQHEEQLLEQYRADGTELPLEPVALAQEPRIRVRAPVAKLRELERDDLEVRDIRGDELRRLITVQPDAERRTALQQLVAMRFPLVEADDDGPRGRYGFRAARVDERARHELTVLDERHQAAWLSAP